MDPDPTTTTTARVTRAAARARATATTAETTTTTSVPAPVPTAAVVTTQAGVDPTPPSAPGEVTMTYDERLSHYGLQRIAEGIYQRTEIQHRLGVRRFAATAENLAALGLQEVSAGLYVKDRSTLPATTAAAPPPAAPPATTAAPAVTEPSGMAALAPGGFTVPVVAPSAPPAYSQRQEDSPGHIPFGNSFHSSKTFTSK